jgi:hypothetical protein
LNIIKKKGVGRLSKKYGWLLMLLFMSQWISAQRGGESLYGLLHLTQSARVTALGGSQAGLHDRNLSILQHNPAVLDSVHTRQVSLSYVNYMAGINYGFGGLAWHFEGLGTMALGFQHTAYGDFIAAEIDGTRTGYFNAGETVIQATYSRPLSTRWTAGLSLKPVFSRLEAYKSWGLAADAGLFYRSDDGLFNGGLVYRNFGRQFSSYSSAPTESLPGYIQLGISQKLAHAPFRVSLTAQDLFSGSLSYTLPESSESGTTIHQEEESGFDKVIKHFVLGLEFVPSDNFYVAGGFNPRRRSELKMNNKASTTGLSWGFGFRIAHFHFAYGSARYHLGGTSNHFSITTNLHSYR